MSEDQGTAFAQMEANVKHNLSKTLTRTFDEIAKIAMRASAEFSFDVDDRSVRERLQNAHAVITLIIDDAMRGLGDATTVGMAFAVVSTMKQYEEPDGSTAD
jgi:hypothetical protein